MFPNHQLESILAQWPTGRLPIRSIQPVSGGLSGACIWKIETTADSRLALGNQSVKSTWALKAWPSATPLKRLKTIHALVRQAAANCDLLTEPAMTGDQRSFISAHDRLWDYSPWIAGQPLPIDPSPRSLESAGEAIARVHQAFSIGGPPQLHGVPRAIKHRLQRFRDLSVALQRILHCPPTLDAISNELNKQIPNPQPPNPAEECHALAGVLTLAIEQLQKSWTLASRKIQQELQTFTDKSEELQIRGVLRDVHRGHVFVDPAQGNITGVIDYDAIGLDTPSTDVARFAGSFQTVDLDPLHATAAGYRRIQPLSELEYDLAQTIMLANIIGGLANWVVWLVGEKKTFLCEASLIRGRISHLIASNCRIC